MTITYNPQLSDYTTALFAAEDEVLKHIRQASLNAGLPDIAISPEEGAFLQLMARLAGAHRIVEIGTLGGYSTVWLGRALPEQGMLFSLEKSAAHAQMARRHVEMAGLSQNVRVLEGDAHQLLPGLQQYAPFDMVFADAEKSGLLAYFAWALANLRPGGLFAAHNAYWGGSVAGDFRGEVIDQMREFNRFVAQHPQVQAHIYPAGDGTLLAVKLA